MLLKLIQIKNQYIASLETNLANSLAKIDELDAKVKELQNKDIAEAVQVLEDEGGLPNQ